MKDIKEILSQYTREELEECKKMELQGETIDKDKIDVPLKICAAKQNKLSFF